MENQITEALAVRDMLHASSSKHEHHIHGNCYVGDRYTIAFYRDEYNKNRWHFVHIDKDQQHYLSVHALSGFGKARVTAKLYAADLDYDPSYNPYWVVLWWVGSEFQIENRVDTWVAAEKKREFYINNAVKVSGKNRFHRKADFENGTTLHVNLVKDNVAGREFIQQLKSRPNKVLLERKSNHE